MFDKDNIIADIAKSTNDFGAYIENYSQKELDQEPEKGGWPAGTILAHLILAEELVNQVVAGPGKPGKTRDPGRKVKLMKTTFLNLDKKLTAFGPIIPEEKDSRDKKELMIQFRAGREKFMSLLDEFEVTDICTSFAHPLFGMMTRAEWAYYNYYHCERHYRQLKSRV